MIKTCSRCGETKPLWSFYRQAIQSDGFAPHCKACHKAAYTDRAWNKSEKGIAASREASKRWYRKNPEKHRAHRLLKYHVLVGHIIKPEKCQECGAATPLDAHHHDYAKPFDVRWLCRSCHKNEHSLLEALAAPL